MHPAHATITGLLILSALTLFAGLRLEVPGLVALGVMSGWLFSVVAIVGAIVVALVLAVRAVTGRPQSALLTSWLGLFNGVAALIAVILLVRGAI